MTAAAAAPVDPAHVDTASPEAALAAAAGAEKAALAAAPKPADPKATEKAPEPKVEPAKAEPPKEPVGQAFARLARAERQRVAKEQAAKAEIESERAKIQAERAEVERLREEAKSIREAEAHAKADPGGYLERLYGKDWYEKLTEYRLAGKPTADLAVRALEEKVEGRIEALKREQEEIRKRDADEREKAIASERSRIAEEQKAIVEQFHAETVEFVKAHPEEYELTNLYDGGDLVVEVIKETYQTTKRVLSAKEAAELVERHFEEQVELAGKTKKLGSRFAKPEPAKEEPVKPAPTLSNATAAAPSFTGPPKTEEERIARAIAAMEESAAKRRTA